MNSSDFDCSSRASSNQDPIVLNDEEKDDDDEIYVNVDIEEILQQIISLKEDNFEQMSSNFPSLKHIIRSAEKYQRSGIPEATFTQFHRSFPVSSEDPPGFGIAESPVVIWLAHLPEY